jgi:integral membrane protein
VRNSPIGRLRVVGLLEGLSYLILLGVAMPLKYAAGMPQVVKVVGWIHGVLFVLFVAALAQARSANGWPLQRTVVAFIAALVPFGTFWLDRQLRREGEQAAAEPIAPS